MKNATSWQICTSADDILNFIIYIGCIYGLIDSNTYTGKAILWPSKALNTEATGDQWKAWFKEVSFLKAEKVKLGLPNTLYEEYMAPEFSTVKCPILEQCCKDAWPQFHEWWGMMAGGKNASAFIETLGNNKIYEYVNEVEDSLGRKLKPFSLNIELVYTGINKVIDINSEFIISPLSPIITLDKQWWIRKLSEIG